MSRFKVIFLLLIVPLLSISASTALEEVIIKIGSHCDHFDQCETGKSRLEKELMLTSGVKAVTIDSKTMMATIKYNPKRTKPEKIRQVISEAGYDADDIKANPKGERKLDDCCQKKE
jgi:copper chaperone CopZ